MCHNEAINVMVKLRYAVHGTFLSDMMLLSFSSIDLSLSHPGVSHMAKASTDSGGQHSHGIPNIQVLIALSLPHGLEVYHSSCVWPPPSSIVSTEQKRCGWFLLKAIGPDHKGHWS